MSDLIPVRTMHFGGKHFENYLEHNPLINNINSPASSKVTSGIKGDIRYPQAKHKNDPKKREGDPKKKKVDDLRRD